MVAWKALARPLTAVAGKAGAPLGLAFSAKVVGSINLAGFIATAMTGSHKVSRAAISGLVHAEM